MFTKGSKRVMWQISAMAILKRRHMLTLGATMFVLGMAPATSQASAYGYQYWNPFTMGGIKLAAGQLYHAINGGGYHIKWEVANYASASNLCDSSIKFTYGNGRYEYTGTPAHSNVHWGCSPVGQWKYWWDWNAPRGSACAELWIKNWRQLVTKQCHYIHD